MIHAELTERLSIKSSLIFNMADIQCREYKSASSILDETIIEGDCYIHLGGFDLDCVNHEDSSKLSYAMIEPSFFELYKLCAEHCLTHNISTEDIELSSVRLIDGKNKVFGVKTSCIEN